VYREYQAALLADVAPVTGMQGSNSLGIQPRVKSLRSSYTGLYPQTLHGVVSPELQGSVVATIALGPEVPPVRHTTVDVALVPPVDQTRILKSNPSPETRNQRPET